MKRCPLLLKVVLALFLIIEKKKSSINKWDVPYFACMALDARLLITTCLLTDTSLSIDTSVYS